ncbi:hypothetical protein L1987_59628 [Smallanthus sonchifolius]|uniref:Uncharacterized protein n=2 Tax=Smallanthus sonchifolius TaxID=185202 RepID=A0ACB9D6D1_9ASTR|nr:hypothetical protein L1987_59627 [Smallanthus sonchifolius]KAI3741949.1 hypothetical protein L1987_59628 [Smallanthus sonchifolius]
MSHSSPNAETIIAKCIYKHHHVIRHHVEDTVIQHLRQLPVQGGVYKQNPCATPSSSNPIKPPYHPPLTLTPLPNLTMAAIKLILGFFLCLLGTTVIATTRSPRLGGPEFCNLQQLHTAQPAQRFEFEGGSIETWDEKDEQFQCLGVATSRKTIQPNSLSLPAFRPFPHLIFIEQGEGYIGVQLPGCAETFDTGVQQQHQQQQPRRMREQFDSSSDSHQKVHRFQQGDIIAIPAGAVHWAYNDGNQEVVAIVFDDINNPTNQLDMQHRTFHLAGGISSQHVQGQQGRKRSPISRQQQGSLNVESIYSGFDTELLAEAFSTDPQIVRALQQSSERGLIVKVQQRMEFVTPEERQEQRSQRRSGGPSNGVEQKICSSKFVYNLENQREADFFSRQAGKLNMNALISPHWSINSHSIVYVLSGDAEVQVVSNNGEAVLSEQVNKGEFFVVPQFFATTARAGQNGFEWVAFKTNKAPMKSPVAGYTSVFRAMPLDVITNAYEVSPSQAQNLKTNREMESILFSPQPRK